MAIINAKRLEADEEAERNARMEAEEYAARNDRSWQQPPPAYEEAANATASSSSSAAQQGRNSNVEIITSNESYTAQQVGNSVMEQRSPTRQNAEESDDESMPLLTRRQKILLKKRLRNKEKYRRFCRFLFAFLLSTSVLFLILNLFINKNGKGEMPEPWWDDGQPIQGPDWSPVRDTPQESWPLPNIPQYTSNTAFSVAANESLAFVRAHGSTYRGVIITLPATSLAKDEWENFRDGPMLDRIGIVVEAKFSDRDLLNKVRIDKMSDKRGGEIREGISINGGNQPYSRDESLILNVYVFLPDSIFRTSPQGLARDGTSWIRNLELSSDNLRIAVEGYDGRNDDMPEAMGWTFGKLAVNAKTGGITIGMTVRANESISLQIDTGQIRDIYFREPTLITLAAPKVDVTTANGPIWISGAVGIDHLNLRSITGGLNISHIAVAEKVSCSSSVGVLGGRWSAYQSITARTTGDLWIDVNAGMETYMNYLKTSGLLAILNSEKTAKILARSNKEIWRTLKVDAFTKTGEIIINYKDQDPKTLLLSNVTTDTGSITVTHSRGFEGEYDIRTKVGTILINQPDAEKPEWEKQFTIDFDIGDGRIGRLIKGRSWLKSHKWQDGGSKGSSLFPISRSTIMTKVGKIRANFA